jgi:hypothetical protein
MSRLAHTDRASGVVVRYQREHPGELVHLEVKKLGRIPDGGGHRIHGRATATRGRGIGYDYLHSAVDDRSRVAFSQLLPDETGATSARFLVEAAGFFADHGVVIQRVLTDNAKAYAESVVFAETAAGLGIRLKRTRPYRPQTNGKVERFNRTLPEEWAYARLYHSNTERCRAFARWLRFYNHRRTTHLARRPDPDGGPRQQRWWEPQLARRPEPSCKQLSRWEPRSPRGVPEVDGAGAQRVWPALRRATMRRRFLAFLCWGACGLVVPLPGAAPCPRADRALLPID